MSAPADKPAAEPAAHEPGVIRNSLQFANDLAWGVYSRAEQFTVVKTAIDLTKPVVNMVTPITNPVTNTVVSVADPWVDTIDSIVSSGWYWVWGKPSKPEQKEIHLMEKFKDKQWNEIVLLTLNDAAANGKTLSVSRAKVVKDDISAAIAASSSSARVYDHEISAVQFKTLWEKMKMLAEETQADAKDEAPCDLVTLRIKDNDQQFPVAQDKLYGLFKAALDLDLTQDITLAPAGAPQTTWKPPASPRSSGVGVKPPGSPAARPKVH